MAFFLGFTRELIKEIEPMFSYYYRIRIQEQSKQFLLTPLHKKKQLYLPVKDSRPRLFLLSWFHKT
jgi:hypothetical protein